MFEIDHSSDPFLEAPSRDFLIRMQSSDKYQSQAMYNIIQKYGWKQFSILTTFNSYGMLLKSITTFRIPGLNRLLDILYSNRSSRNVKFNTDWDRFTESLALCQTLENLNSALLETTAEIDRVASLLVEFISTNQQAACQITYTSCKIKLPPWFTPEVRNARRGIR